MESGDIGEEVNTGGVKIADGRSEEHPVVSAVASLVSSEICASSGDSHTIKEGFLKVTLAAVGDLLRERGWPAL